MLGSILTFASCAIHRPLVFTDVLSFEYIHTVVVILVRETTGPDRQPRNVDIV